jgi:hypothetical protein
MLLQIGWVSLAAMQRPLRVTAAVALGLALLVAPGHHAAAQPGDDSDGPKVLLLGDSVIELLCEYTPAELDELRRHYDVTCDGHDVEPYRRTGDGPGLIRAHVDAFDDHLVIALGYNDGFHPGFADQAEEIMAMPEVQAVPHVYWLTLRDVGGRYGDANDALAALERRYDNLTLLDWDSVSADDPRRMTRSDGVHLTEAGGEAMADLITDALQHGLRRELIAGRPWLSHPPGFLGHLPNARVVLW